MKTKKCRSCKKEKRLECFARNCISKDGLQYYCRDCNKVKYRKRWANPELKKRMMDSHNKYRQQHVRKINEQERRRGYQRRGLQAPEKQYKYYRDCIYWVLGRKENVIWQQLLSLKLTERQEQLVRGAMNGKSQTDMSIELNCCQHSISKSWDMIYRKIRKHLRRPLTPNL